MERSLNRLIALAAVLAVLVTAVAVGHAQAQPRAAGLAVLCIDGVARTVAVDADGKPLAAGHTCPDCVLAFASPLPDMVGPAAPCCAERAIDPPLAAVHLAGHQPLRATARAPPFV